MECSSDDTDDQRDVDPDSTILPGTTRASMATSSSFKLEPGALSTTESTTDQDTRYTEENWSTLSNLRVTSEAKLQVQEAKLTRRSTDYVYLSSSLDEGNFSKSSLSFILDDKAASTTTAGGENFTTGIKRAAAFSTRSSSVDNLTSEETAAVGLNCNGTETVRPGGKQGGNRKHRPPSRICKHEDCEQYVVDQGLCVRHGGGKRCKAPGCSSRAKHHGRCWKHGGSIECKIPSCINRAKSRGFCWTHGGGTKCKAEKCEKIAISNGLCWAHGGGKRCTVSGCMRQAYERTDNLCNHHFHQQQGEIVVAETEAVNCTAVTSLDSDDEEKPPAPSFL